MEGRQWEGKVRVTSLPPTVSLTQIPVHEQGDAGKCFIKQSGTFHSEKKVSISRV